MVKDRFECLNKLLIVIDSFDEPEDLDVLAGVAINVDDMDDFLRDVEKLAVEKYGGTTFEELVYEDESDLVADRAIAQSRKESADRVVREAEEITKEALGKRGIARMPEDDPIEFFLRDYLDEFKNGIASEGLMEDAHECGIAALAAEFRTEGLDAEDIEKAPGSFVAVLSLSQLLDCLAWHFKRETWIPGSIKESIGSGGHVPVRGRLPGRPLQDDQIAGAVICPCRRCRGRACLPGVSMPRRGSRRHRSDALPARVSPAPPRPSA